MPQMPQYRVAPFSRELRDSFVSRHNFFLWSCASGHPGGLTKAKYPVLILCIAVTSWFTRNKKHPLCQYCRSQRALASRLWTAIIMSGLPVNSLGQSIALTYSRREPF